MTPKERYAAYMSAWKLIHSLSETAPSGSAKDSLDMAPDKTATALGAELLAGTVEVLK